SGEQGGKLTPRRLDALWSILGGEDAPKAYQTIWTLIEGHEQSVSFLRNQLRPVAPIDPHHLARLIADLDHRRWAVREKATRELGQLGELAEPALRQAWKGRLSAETRKRIGELLEKQEGQVFSRQEVRVFRALEVLELVGTKEAREAVERLAQGF